MLKFEEARMEKKVGYRAHGFFSERPFSRATALNAVGVLVFSVLLNGCGEYAMRGAAGGAATGAISSALGTLVVGLVFNDRHLAERVGRSAVYGATVGATAGAIGGATHDQRIRRMAEEREAAAAARRAQAAEAQTPMTDAEILKAIGRKNFEALIALSDCRFGEAAAKAKEEETSLNRDYREAALWIQAIAAVETGDSAALDRISPRLVELDPDLGQPEKADAALAEALQALYDDRKTQGRPPKCPGL